MDLPGLLQAARDGGEVLVVEAGPVLMTGAVPLAARTVLIIRETHCATGGKALYDILIFKKMQKNLHIYIPCI